MFQIVEEKLEDVVVNATDLICINNRHDSMAAPLAADIIVERARGMVWMSILL